METLIDDLKKVMNSEIEDKDKYMKMLINGFLRERDSELLTIQGVVKSLKDEEVIPFEDWRKDNCTHLEGDLYSFKHNVFDSYDLRYVYMRECKQSL
jgi:hypothetical protein